MSNRFSSTHPQPLPPPNLQQQQLPLTHLPLRPSTLALLTTAGFRTASEVWEAAAQPKNSKNSSSSGGGGGGWTNLAAELGCTLTTAYEVGREVFGLAAAGVAYSGSGSSGDAAQNNNNRRLQQTMNENNNPNSFHANRSSAVQLLQQQQQQQPQPNASLQIRHNTSTITTATSRSIITFCRDLDTVLQGGIALQGVTELAGPPGTGKTALGTQLAVNAALPVYLGGVHGQCVYIDTEGSFSAERCHTLAQSLVHHVQAGWRRRQRRGRVEQQQANASTSGTVNQQQQQQFEDGTNDDDEGWKATPQEILEGIHVFRVHDAAHLEAVLHGALPALLLQQQQQQSNKNNNNKDPNHNNHPKPIKLVIVDSMAFPYRAYDIRHTDFVTRTRQLTRHCHHLTQLAQQYDLAVVVVNQMTTTTTMIQQPGGDNHNNAGGAVLVPALGESWAHAVTTRLLLSVSPPSSSSSSQQQQQRRTCRLTKSPRLPTAAADFQIVEAGVRGMEYQCSSSSTTSEDNHGNRKRRHSTHPPAPAHPHHHHQ